MPIKPRDGLVGFASFVLDDSLYLGSIGILTRPEGGYRVAFPTRTVAGKGFSVYHPINKPVAQEIERIILEKFEAIHNGHH